MAAKKIGEKIHWYRFGGSEMDWNYTSTLKVQNGDIMITDDV